MEAINTDDRKTEEKFLKNLLTPEMNEKRARLTCVTDANPMIRAQDVTEYGIQSVRCRHLSGNWYEMSYRSYPQDSAIYIPLLITTDSPEKIRISYVTPEWGDRQYGDHWFDIPKEKIIDDQDGKTFVETFYKSYAHTYIKKKLNISTKPFIPVLPPLMIRTEMYDAMDRLEPREDRYKIEGEELWLQGSAEHVLGSMHAGEIFSAEDLPLRYLGYATSFRQEAGTYGKDMEGIIRMHQFDKLEMESFSTKETSRDEHELFVGLQRWLLEQLELPYRVIKKCTFDIGKPNARGIDMEVWLPGQDKYRETHTADYMTDYQARRLNTRVRTASGEVELIHTNDATAFALGRIMIAIIENYQNEDQTVRVPKVLQKYLDGKEII